MNGRKQKKLKYLIRKVNKSYEEFDTEKYKRSLEAAGVSKEDTDKVVEQISQGLEPLCSTNEIHRKTYRALKKISQIDAANYNIKRAIYKLGPTGYPFEVLCSEMLKAKGYKTRVSVIKKGMYVKHEVDVLAKRDDGDIYCECKFHNRKYYKNDVKIPLYVHSRYLDIKEANPEENFKYALISNTQFSEDAIRYANGVGLLLYSMNYPKKNTFCRLIERYRIYPITVLSSLKVRHKNALLAKNIVIIKNLKKGHLEELGLSKSEISKVFEEIRLLLRRD